MKMYLERNRSFLQFLFTVFFISVLLFANAGRASNADQEEYFERQEEVDLRQSALTSAYAEAAKRRLSSRNKILVIKRYGELIVVSFLDEKPAFGGPSHFVFDVKSKKIIRVDFSE